MAGKDGAISYSYKYGRTHKMQTKSYFPRNRQPKKRQNAGETFLGQ